MTNELKESKNTNTTRGWPPERRQKQAERIREQKPWKQSTGPKSDPGKAVSKLNAYKHGFRGVEMDEIRALLRLHEQLTKRIVLEARIRARIQQNTGLKSSE